MSSEFSSIGTNTAARFSLKLHRGEGAVLLAMNWHAEFPPMDFVGFAIEYREPGSEIFYSVKNRLAFRQVDLQLNPNALSSLQSPIQKFRWVHFPRNADLTGDFTYRITPVFMNPEGQLSYGEAQLAGVELRRETFPGEMNVAFTRGFVSSQAFVDKYGKFGEISTLLPNNSQNGLTFKPSHPKADEAMGWMGFEARTAILDVLDKAVEDKEAQVRVIAYDLDLPEVVERLEKLGPRLTIIIDDSSGHDGPSAEETLAENRLLQTAGASNVKRQHVLGLQHNKLIVINSPTNKYVVCGSTNFSWRGFYVQSNNAVILTGSDAVNTFGKAFDDYLKIPTSKFKESTSANWTELAFSNLKLGVSFSPHGRTNMRLDEIAHDIVNGTSSSLFYSLAFLSQTPGPVREAIGAVTNNKQCFVYGISDREVGGLDVQLPNGNVAPVHPEALKKNAPAPFSEESAGGGGVRMHHKFIVIDFDKPTARVYLGSHNFSSAADKDNGENLLLIKDRRVATAYMVEALRLFDHYHFRITQANSATAKKELTLARPPKSGEKPWWHDDYNSPRKIMDRKLFA